MTNQKDETLLRTNSYANYLNQRIELSSKLCTSIPAEPISLILLLFTACNLKKGYITDHVKDQGSLHTIMRPPDK